MDVSKHVNESAKMNNKVASLNAITNVITTNLTTMGGVSDAAGHVVVKIDILRSILRYLMNAKNTSMSESIITFYMLKTTR